MSVIDWNVSDSNFVYNKYRALCGLWPLITTWHGKQVKILKVNKYQMSSLEVPLEPGKLICDKRKNKLLVKCGGKGGYVSIEKLKISGHKTMTGIDFFNGFICKQPNSDRKFDITPQ